MEIFKWDPWWENDWPVSSFPDAKPNGANDQLVAIEEAEDKYVIKARMTGFQKEEIKVTVEHGLLSMICEHDEKEESSPGKSVGVKPCRCHICRTFSLPGSIDASGVRAKMLDGWLQMEVPKFRGSNGQEIRVSIN